MHFAPKYQTWQAAEDDFKPAVAGLKDRPADHPRSFRGRILAAENGGEVLGDFLWDFWVAQRWQEICLEELPEETLQRVEKTGKEMARNYVRYGSTNPTKIERLIIEKKGLEREVQTLADKVDDLETRLYQEQITPKVDTSAEMDRMRLEGVVLELSESLKASKDDLKRVHTELSEVRGSANEAEKAAKDTFSEMDGEILKLTKESRALRDENNALREETSLLRTIALKYKELYEGACKLLKKIPEIIKIPASIFMGRPKDAPSERENKVEIQ